MGTWSRTAARNNAEWCDVMCRSHCLQTRFDDDAWTSPTRTPPYYPDAVTLVANPSVPDLLSHVDTAAGCSIKDSFASLDLTGYGFRVLFDAQWIIRTSTLVLPDAEAGPRWERLRDPDDLATWAAAWRRDDGPTDLFRPELLEDNSIAVLAARVRDQVVAGAVLNRSSTVVGISNFFADERFAATSWAGCLSLAGSLFPASNFVGYESGDQLAAAEQRGFEAVGPLRVWIYD